MSKRLSKLWNGSLPLWGFLSAAIGFGSDILQPLAPLTSYIFFASAFSALVILISMIVSTSLRTGLSKSFLFALSMMICSGGLYFLNDEENIDTGIIASIFPAINNLQFTLGLVEQEVVEIKKLAENIKNNTQENIEATREVASAVPEFNGTDHKIIIRNTKRIHGDF